ncbi:PilN domain-containing protein [Dryocola sp. LX212]
MRGVINLLPWRQHQRLIRLRFWSLLAAGCLLALLLTELARAVSLSGQAAQQRLYEGSLADLQGALQHKQQTLLELERQQQAEQQLKVRRQRVKAWESRFIQLAAGLPVGVWLKALSLTGDKVNVQGYAAAAEDIHLAGRHFQTLDGVDTVQWGEVNQEGEGRIGFAMSMGLAQGGKDGRTLD